MNYRHMDLRCRCGEVPESIAEVGFTADHELVVHWWCPTCHRVESLTRPLAQCWNDCPDPGLTLDAALEKWEESQRALDRDFLRSVGVIA